ncbi:MAG: MmgE/PrpD family protein [Rubrivivax sp.]|nr:MmgE/PrpD family protein [Rubrivivax sp.]
MLNGQTQLARFAAGLRIGDLPATVRTRAGEIASDLSAVIAAGMREAPMRRLAATLAPAEAGGPCDVLSHPSRTRSEAAALLHGTAGTFLELDEGNRFSRGHPGVHVFPAALAVAQERHATGRELLAALVAGYEVAARLGAACEVRPGVHPHGTWGTVGAAVAVRKLLGTNEASMERTIAIASTLGLATSVKTMREGGLVRNAFAGAAGKMGILANALADAGFSGENDGLASVYGGIIATGFDWHRMLQDLGTRWEMLRNYFKLHACCRFSHAALDALAIALARAPHPVTVDDIERIDVDTYSLAAQLVNPDPVNGLAAKYSLPFAVATALVNGSTGIEAFADATVDDPAVRRLAHKVQVREDTAMTQQLPALRQARVRLVLHSGEVLKAFVHTNRGDAETPYASAELEDKFMRLAQGTWSEPEATRIRRRLLALEDVRDTSALFGEANES